MNEKNVINVFEVVGSPLCVSSDDGHLVYEKIEKFFLDKKMVVLSFKNTETIISAFLNAAIGQLYGKFSEDEIRNLLSISDMSNEDLSLLKRVVDNAKIYFKNRESFDKLWDGENAEE